MKIKRGARFTEREINILKSCSYYEACRRLPHRSKRCVSVTQWRQRNGHGVRAPLHGVDWSADELKAMRTYYAVMSNKDLIAKHLPGRTRDNVTAKARRMKLRKRYLGTVSANVPLCAHAELVDQIIIRAKADGIPISKLDKALRLPTKHYFQNRNRKQHRVNLVAVAAAVEYFGAKLVIDWCDR